MATDDLRKLDWNLLRVFAEIARAGGVSEAARKLGRKQPAISLALKRLEEHLGVRLCDRGPAGFQLTEEGEFIADITGRMVQLVEEVPGRITQLSELVSGTIRIMVISNVVDEAFDDAIASFQHCFAGRDIPCRAACDTTGDGNPCSGIADGIRILLLVFRNGAPFPPPFPACDSSESLGDRRIGCETTFCP